MTLPSVTLITPTGSRPEAFKLCEKFMARQTFKGSIQWIVVDDSPKNPTVCTMGQEYYVGPLEWSEGINTQRYNLALGLSKVKGDYVFIIEDDDNYQSEYIEVYLDFLKRAFLVGEGETFYYSLKEEAYKPMLNYKHASLCQTAFRKGAIPFITKAIHSGEVYTDIVIWNRAKQGNIKHILFNGMNLCTGIKGFVGRTGIGVGHRPADFIPDPDHRVLRQLVRNDYNLYKPFLGKK